MIIHEAYEEIIHWCNNLFTVLFGHVGQQFVSELARLFIAYADCSPLESVALRALFVLCSLLLQPSQANAKPHELLSCLTRWLNLWHDGQIKELLTKGTQEQRLVVQQHKSNSNSL